MKSARRQGKYCVEAFGIEDLPHGAIVENNIQDTEAVGTAIQKALIRSRSRLKKTAIAVSGAAVITKLIEMDASLNDSEMNAQILVEADQYIPYPLDEVAIDFEVQSLNEQNPKQADVLLAACRKDSIELREDVLAIAGLEASIIDVESLAIERAFELVAKQVATDKENPVIAVIDMGAFSTSLYVLQQNQTIYTREQVFGSHQLTEEIEHAYNMTTPDAEKAKKNNTLPDDYDHQILTPFRDSTVEHIARSLQFFYSSSNYSEVDGIILAGGAALMKGMAEALQTHLKIETTQADPFAHMSLARKVDGGNLNKVAPAFLVACGLAMRSFDNG